MNRAALIAKIKALLAKTVVNGCTEAEAMSALEKARSMMAEYAIGQDDITFGGEECIREGRVGADRDRIRQSLAVGVGLFCECRTWSGPRFEQINFCGLESDVGFAHWLLDMLADFVGRELALFLERTWKPGTPRVRRLESNGFVNGCCHRIGERLAELAPKPQPGNGRDLVVAKNALIDAAMADAGIKLKNNWKSHRIDNRAHAAGERAGDQAQFNRPIDGRGPVLAIGRR